MKPLFSWPHRARPMRTWTAESTVLSAGALGLPASSVPLKTRYLTRLDPGGRRALKSMTAEQDHAATHQLGFFASSTVPTKTRQWFGWWKA